MEDKKLEQEESPGKNILSTLREMRNLIQDTLGIVTPVEKRKVLRRAVTQLRGRALWRLRLLVLVVYTRKWKIGKIEHQRVRVIPAYKAARLPFLQQVLTHLQTRDLGPELEYLKDIKYPMVFLQNDQQSLKDTGRIPEIPWKVIQAMNETSGMIVIKGKALLAMDMVRFLARTFPYAAEMVYVKRLGGPSIGNGFRVNPEVRLEQLKVPDAYGNMIVQGCDGSGRIHPMHPIWADIGVDINKRGAIQVTLWHPIKGAMWKGILVASEKAIDKDGHAIIVFDREQVKGTLKNSIKKFLGEGGVHTFSKGLYLGVMNKWDEPGYIKASFQFVQQFLTEGKAAKAMVTGSIHEEILRFKHNGGVQGVAEKLALDDEQLAMCYALCDLIKWKPMWLPFYRSRIEEKMERWIWHLTQGAGLTADQYVCLIDNSVPKGCCVMRSHKAKDGWRYYHGQEIVVTRSPIVLSQGIRVMKVLDPTHETFKESGYLSHLLVKTKEGRDVPFRIIAMNGEDVEAEQADDDGDVMMVFHQPEIVKAVKEDLRPPIHGPDVLYALEPAKDLKGPRAMVKTWEEGKGPSPEALRIMGVSSQGPVGLLAILQAAFYSLSSLAKKWKMYVLACAGAEQEALDSEKHNVIASSLDAMARKSNWKLKDADSDSKKYTLKEGLKADKSCLEDPEAGKDYLSAGFIFNWFRILTGAEKMRFPKKGGGWAERLVGGDKLAEVLPWRPEKGQPKKRMSFEQLRQRRNAERKGKTLVNWSMDETYRLLVEELGQQLEFNEEPHGSLVELLPLALGPSFAVAKLKMPKAEYRKLLKRSGLVEYGRLLKKLWRREEDDEDSENRHRRAEREEAILAEKMVLYGKLSTLSVRELATIWVTELSEKVEPDYRESKINRAFRAVCFPGSPVLAELGVEVPFTCTWAALRMDDIEKDIRNIELSGRGADIIESALMWIHDNTEHQVEVGIPLTKCKNCRELVRYKGVSMARSKQGLAKGFNEFVASLVSPINARIAELIKPTPVKKK